MSVAADLLHTCPPPAPPAAEQHRLLGQALRLDCGRRRLGVRREPGAGGLVLRAGSPMRTLHSTFLSSTRCSPPALLTSLLAPRSAHHPAPLTIRRPHRLAMRVWTTCCPQARTSTCWCWTPRSTPTPAARRCGAGRGALTAEWHGRGVLGRLAAVVRLWQLAHHPHPPTPHLPAPQSKASPLGAVVQFAAGGKTRPKKELALMMMQAVSSWPSK